jgi:hypothetical protein
LCRYATATDETIDKFKIKGLSKGGELKWKCGAFKASLEGGFWSRGNTAGLNAQVQCSRSI